jgi:formylglycine-generating enzyme required for sulfatase activity
MCSAKNDAPTVNTNDEWTVSDFLDRRALVQAVARIAATWQPPLTIGIYGPWGEGKTSTMRMVQAVLEPDSGKVRKGLTEEWQGPHGLDTADLPALDQAASANVVGTVWFDPWQYQFEDTPAYWLVRTIVSTAEDRLGVKPEEARACFALKRFAVGFAEGLSRALTAGNAGIGDVVGSMAVALGPEALEKSFADIFLENYREAIEEIIRAAGRKKAKASRDGPDPRRLVVFLNDLDRCQPQYVVRMLEALKLALSHPRCVYVVGIDEGVVAAAIEEQNRAYAEPGRRTDFSGERYLEKIVQLPVRLPPLPAELAQEFVMGLVPPGSALASSVSEDDWRAIQGILRVGLRRNPRHAKRFVMLLQLTVELADAKLGRARAAGGPQTEKRPPVSEVNYPLLAKLLLIQFQWPRVPRDVAVLKRLEWMCQAPEGTGDDASDAGAQPTPSRPEPSGQNVEFDAAMDRYGIVPVDRDGLRNVLAETEPKLHPIRDDVVRYHIDLTATTVPEQEPVRADEARGEVRFTVRPDFKAEVAREDGQGVTIRLTGDVGMELRPIPGGSFTMGSPEDEEGRRGDETQHEVTLSRYCMGVYPVTQDQWKAVFSENPSHFEGDRKPVERVNWHEADHFCRVVSRAVGRHLRLPTEAEWEYACRAGTSTRFWSGDTEEDLARVAWYDGNSEEHTRDVGGKAVNAWGLHDVHGNVWEWCADWYAADYYGQGPAKDPRGPEEGQSRVLRGGSWSNYPLGCRSAYRYCSGPDDRLGNIGVRVVLLPRP